jgi:hypothetical protein
VPGSPFTIIGLSKVMAALTATFRSSVAIYELVPSNFIKFLKLFQETYYILAIYQS